MCIYAYIHICHQVLSIMGLFLALVVREICETDDDITASCSGLLLNIIKSVTSVATLLQCYLMWIQIDTSTELVDTRQALLDRARGRQIKKILNTRHDSQAFVCKMYTKVCLNPVKVFIWIPINLIHPLPGVSFTIATAQLGLRPIYRVESFIAAFMVVRIVHVYLLFKLKLVIRYLNLDSSLVTRNEGAVLLLNDPGLSQATLALKISLMRNPTLIIMLAWLVLILTTAVVIRVSESTFGVDSSPYLWDQLWLVCFCCVFMEK
jgi:hypothetical protein